MVNIKHSTLFISFLFCYCFCSQLYAQDRTNVTFHQDSNLLIIDGITPSLPTTSGVDAIEAFAESHQSSMSSRIVGEQVMFFSFDWAKRDDPATTVRSTVLGTFEDLLEYSKSLHVKASEDIEIGNYGVPGSGINLSGEPSINESELLDLSSIDKFLSPENTHICIARDCFPSEVEWIENISDEKETELVNIQEYINRNICDEIGCIREGTNCTYCCSRNLNCCGDDCSIIASRFQTEELP